MASKGVCVFAPFELQQTALPQAQMFIILSSHHCWLHYSWAEQALCLWSNQCSNPALCQSGIATPKPSRELNWALSHRGKGLPKHVKMKNGTWDISFECDMGIYGSIAKRQEIQVNLGTKIENIVK